MASFQMTCSCGDVMKVEAETREEGVTKMKEMMDQTAIEKHCAEKHADQPVMTVEEVHASIDKDLVDAV
jgi:hypothetical protein